MSAPATHQEALALIATLTVRSRQRRLSAEAEAKRDRRPNKTEAAAADGPRNVPTRAIEQNDDHATT